MAIACDDLNYELEVASRQATNARRQVDELLQEVENGAVGSGIAARLATLESFVNQINTKNGRAGQSLAQSDCTPAKIDELRQLARATRNQVGTLRSDLRRAQRLYQENEQARNTPDTTPANSAGEEAQEDKKANVEGSKVTNPPLKTSGSPNNTSTAEQPATTNDTELSDEDAVSRVRSPRTSRRSRQTQSGDATTNDDNPATNQSQSSGVSTTVQGQVAVANEFTSPIVFTPNKLEGLASTSYTLSIYMMNASEYKSLMTTENYSLPTQQLLIQSAGAPAGKRNKYFDLDFYIEDCEIETVIGTQQVGGSHTIGKIYFKIVEPNGITMLSRLKAAVQEHTGITGETHELSQHYLLVIRFYGYDQDGNLISGDQLGTTQRTTDPNSITEKFIPFIIGKLGYRIASQGTTYEIEAVGINTQIAYSQKRGTIPFNMQISAPDIATILNGRLVTADMAGTSLGGSAGDFEGIDFDQPDPSQSIVAQGLTDALNEHQQRMVNDGRINVPDKYIIKIEDAPGLSDAQMVKPGRISKKNAEVSKDKTANKFDPSRLPYNQSTRTWNITAGTQIVQLIDLLMRNSTYIAKQQNLQIDEKTGQPIGDAGTTVQWFRVRAHCIPLGYDSKRKDYAYEITYTISRYQINTPRTPGFNAAKYRGVHKRYDYWFTGQNKEVLDFNIDVNANYYTVFSEKNPDQPAQGRFIASSAYASAPNSTLQGGLNNSTYLSGALAARLYNIADVASTTLKIMGDPDWILQSDFYKSRRVNLNSFLEDGSVNGDASEVLFQIRFNPQNDYNLDTGLQELWSQSNTLQGQVVKEAQETLTWAAHTISSKFQGGAFTTEINGTYRDFAGATGVPLASDGSVAEAESASLSSIEELQAVIDPEPVSAAGALVQVPTQARRLQSNGSTTNFNVPSIDSGQPYRDVMIAGELTRVFGTESDLITYYGNLGQPKSGSLVISDDLGTDIYG